MADLIPKHFQTTIGLGNKVALGNIIEEQNVIMPQDDKTMRALIEKYKKEQNENVVFNNVIEKLENYLNPVNAETQQVIGLEKKLENGQFSDFFDYAVQVKDIFSREIEKHRFSKAAQEILVFLLADVYVTFHQKIYPLILAQTDHSVIMSKISEEIIDRINYKLDDNVLGMDSACVSGMIYFLTGNCHIKWSKS